MIDGGQHDMGTDEHPIADVNATLVLEMATAVDKNIFADVNVLTTFRIKRREHCEGFVQGLPL